VHRTSCGEHQQVKPQRRRVGRKCRWGLLAGEMSKLQRILCYCLGKPRTAEVSISAEKKRHCGEITERLGKRSRAVHFLAMKVGPGLPLAGHPKERCCDRSWKTSSKAGTSGRATSQWLHPISRVELFKISGQKSIRLLMGESEDEGFVLKAMNCPSTFKFISELRSY